MKTSIPVASLVCLALAASALADTHYVDINSVAPASPYTNLATAATNIQNAVDVAESGDTVLVSEGHYILSSHIGISNAVTLLSAGGPDQALIDGNGSVRCLYLDDNASVVSGFTITNGCGTDAFPFSRGGGVSCAGKTPALTNCTISGNHTTGGGGGIFSGTLYDCRLHDNSGDEGGAASGSVLYYCDIAGNTALSSGGGLYNCTSHGSAISSNETMSLVGGGAHLSTLSQCTLTGNISATYGGGASGGSLSNCTITANTAGVAGGGVRDADVYHCTISGNSANGGGGAYASLLLDSTVFGNETAGGNGGGVSECEVFRCTIYSNTTPADGGAAYDSSLAGCTVYGNWAGDWGGAAKECSLRDCIVYGNSANLDGGAAHLSDLTNCTVYGNAAGGQGGACSQGRVGRCRFYGNRAFSGGAIYSTRAENCLFVGNQADDYGGAALGGTLFNCTLAGNHALTYGGGTVNGSLTNCILYGNSADVADPNYHITITGTEEISYTCTTPLPAGGEGNITNDPQFIDAALTNYHLRTTSPCLNTGLNSEVRGSTDLDGAPRIADGTVDMGAYERNPILYVDPDSPDPMLPYASWGTAATSIQDALEIAADGHTVWVTNGLYLLSTSLVVTNAVTLRSANGPDVTIVYGDGAVGCFDVNVTNCTISGFTITGGNSPGNGGGVACPDASTVITNCTLSGNVAAQGGGAAYKGTLYRCVLIDNEAYEGGGADRSTLDNCLVVSNRADYGGGAIGSTLFNCTVSANHATLNGGGIYDGTAYNTIVYGNTATAGDNHWQALGMTNCCATPLPSGDGCITNDPAFRDPAARDYRLLEGSPCMNAGTNAYVQTSTDLDGDARIAGGIVDMGAYENTPCHYVVESNPASAWPFDTWATAATNIQDAVDAAFPHDTILLSNGFWIAVDPIAVTEEVTIRSLNGPMETEVCGTIGSRCFNLADTACTLSGLMIWNGQPAGNGGGVYCSGRTPVIEDCWIFSNEAGGDGGGVYGGTLQRCLVDRNEAANGGGVADSAAYNCPIFGNEAVNAGGGAYRSELVNCTVGENSAGAEGGGIFEGSAVNCIIYTNAPDNWCADTSAVTYTCTTPLPPGEGCIDDAPRWDNAGLWFESEGLQPDSPCVDAGSNAAVEGDTAFRGAPRIMGDRVDMGSHERNLYHYVDLSCSTPAWPYKTWATASTNIAKAVLAAEPSEVVVITNGHYLLSESVEVTEPITIRSANGPEVTYVDGNGTVSCFSLFSGNACTLSGLTITNGYSTFPGGGISCGDGLPIITNCLIVGNTTPANGGGVSGGSLRGCTLAGNSAAQYGGGSYQSELVACVVSNNSAALHGGGAYDCGLTNCTVVGNTAEDGGGVYGGRLDRCVLTGNTATADGGAAGDALLANCLLTDNSAGQNGGGAHGGVLHNCTLTANHADGDGGGTYGGIVLNTIVYDNSAGGSDPNWSDSTPELTNSCTTPLPPGAGCIDDDAQFRDAGAADFRIARTSPCVNAGGNGFAQGDMDLAGNDRIVDVVDIGAYEYNPYHYVDLNSATPLAPYGSWTTAARAIQDAVDACDTFETVIVTNGTYVLSNEIVVADEITVRSLNGRDATTLDGNGETRCFSVGYSACSIRGFTMRNGLAFRGPGVFGTSGNPSVFDCAFVGNESTGDGGAVHAIGAVSNCTFAANIASGYGGGVSSCGPVIDCTFSGNTAYAGGAAKGSELYRCILAGNVARTHGGGAYYGTLTDCLIAGNAATNHGGGAMSSTLVNCTVVGNKADAGNSASTLRGGGAYFGTADNCIIYGNHADEGDNWYDTTPELLYTCTTPLPPGAGCITNDPQFMYAGAGNYRLKAGSSCINTGNNALAQGTYDLDGHDRILQTTVDMGAYEYYDALYDSDGDGLVDGDETGIYGTSPTNVNTDGDAHDDYEEMVALTDGADSNDYFRILDITGGATVEVWFASSSNRLYSLYARGTLVSGQWAAVSGQLDVVGQEGLDALSDAPATSRFYRITVKLP